MSQTCESCAHFTADDSARALLKTLGRPNEDYGWCRGEKSPCKDCLMPPNHDICHKFTQKDDPDAD